MPRCQNCKQEFRIDPEDFAFYEKMSVPPPTWCPECRTVRRMAWRNERHLFRKKDARTGEEILTWLAPGSPYQVYDRDFWWSDGWDAMSYGRDYDFSRPFFAQLGEFFQAVPWASRNTVNNVNCDFANNLGNSKNCYLCFDLDYAEDSAYLNNAYSTRNSLDITTAVNGELNYDSILVDNCFQTFFSYGCESCRNVWFSRNLTGCSDCFGCVNLRNKQYHIFNKSYTREAYFEELKRMNLGSHASRAHWQSEAQKFWDQFPYKYMFAYKNVNATGDWIANSKNTRDSFNVMNVEDSRYCQDLPGPSTKDCYDYTLWGDKVEQVYESLVVGYGAQRIRFSAECWPAVQDVEYSLQCHSSSNLFACAGLRNKNYCIFNKQYTKEEYHALRERIIRHMNDMPYTDARGRVYRYGEFFPPEFSPFAYNETIAQDFFPLTKEAAEERGFIWREEKAREYQATMAAADLPDHIRDVPDTIVKEIIACASCGRAYRIIQMELDFLRRMNLPLPRACPNCRFAARTRYRNAPKFYNRTCHCGGAASGDGRYANSAGHAHGTSPCPNTFMTSYAPDRKEIIYCEQCYQQEIA